MKKVLLLFIALVVIINVKESKAGTELKQDEIIFITNLVEDLQKQLSSCWNKNIFRPDMRVKPNVEVHIKLAKDGRITYAKIVDMKQYENNWAFRQVADSVVKALKSPQCQTFDVPSERYDLWKEMVINFSPIKN